jgi:putative CocE/NonD family hydrolase
VPVHPEGDLNDIELAWFRKYLTDEEQPETEAAPVRIFVMGTNQWRDESEWPLSRAVPTRMFLHSGEALGTSAPAGGDGPSTFTYDPASPVPTVGGATALLSAFPNGPWDQSKLEARSDVLVFTSDPLDEDLEVTGPVRAVLHAESSAPSTDWVVRLCDVHPDGRSFNICDGILRVDANADQRAPHEIDLWATSNVFMRGHRLRVHVTSSSFPRWDRNLNTGQQHIARLETARQSVYHDAARASYVELPVIPAG